MSLDSDAPANTEDQAGTGATGWRSADGTGTTTLLVRHGQTALSAERRFAGRGDIALTGLGMQQSAATAASLAARHQIDAVITSPLRRARCTAVAVAEAAQIPLVVDDDLVETDFGSWEGLSFAEVHARWPADMAAWLAHADAAPPGGESFAAAGRRVNRALDRLLSARQGQTLVVVSHVTPIKTLICRAMLAPPAALFRTHLDVASVSEITWFADGSAVVRSLNDTAHLQDQTRTAHVKQSPSR